MVRDDGDIMKSLSIAILMIGAILLTGCMSQASDDSRFFDDSSKLFTQLRADMRDMTESMNAGEYEIAKQQAESVITTLDTYEKKLSTYTLKNSQAQSAYAEVVPYVSLTRSSTVYFKQSMDAMISGNVKQANKYIDLSTADLATAEKHLDNINQILP